MADYINPLKWYILSIRIAFIDHSVDTLHATHKGLKAG